MRASAIMRIGDYWQEWWLWRTHGSNQKAVAAVFYKLLAVDQAGAGC